MNVVQTFPVASSRRPLAVPAPVAPANRSVPLVIVNGSRTARYPLTGAPEGITCQLPEIELPSGATNV